MSQHLRQILVFIALIVLSAAAWAQDSLNVRRLSQIGPWHPAFDVAVKGNYAYVAAYGDGLRIVDVTNASSPQEVGFWDTPGYARGVIVRDGFAYVADLSGGLRIINVSEPTAPFETGSFSVPGLAKGIAVEDDYAFIAGLNGLHIIDISDPTTPTLVGAWDSPDNSWYIAISGSIAYLTDEGGGLRIIDISDPTVPIEIGFHDTPGYAYGVAVSGHYVYVADWVGGLRIFDVSNPVNPVEICVYATPNVARTVTIQGNLAYVACDQSGFRIIDISNPAIPVEVGYYDTDGETRRVAVSGTIAYVADVSYLGLYECPTPTYMCAPTSLPFTEGFENHSLDSCWTWIREDTSHWSLTERPGWLRIWTQGGDLTSPPSARNLLLRPRPIEDYAIETKAELDPDHNYQGLGVLAYQDDGNWAFMSRGYSTGRNVCFRAYSNGTSVLNANLWIDETPTYLRMSVRDELAEGHWSQDGMEWHSMGTITLPWLSATQHSVGITAASGIFEGYSAPSIPADCDYFRVDPLPGTSVCGDVSGVWDSTGSPYYMTCDVTVPVGQTLEIRPGVQVLFTGHYKFNVFGSLQAIGTEQDSIVFTRAFPTEESRWWGIRVIGASDTTHLRYCSLQYGNATLSGNAVDDQGGALYVRASTLDIDHCAFLDNHANAGGGAAYVEGAMWARFTDCMFIGNSTNDSNAGSGAGAIEMHFTTDVVLRRCLFVANTTLTEGGALVVDGQGGGSTGICEVSECTFAYNSCRADLAGSCIVGRYAYLTRAWNCVFWNNAQTPVQSYGPSVITGYSDIQGGWPGTGNIVSDPMFVDAANGDFHLQAGSPCIDTGDPDSPLNPDSTRADMGAFPYSHPNLSLYPHELDFDLIDLGTDSLMRLSFFNPTTQPIDVQSISSSGPAFSYVPGELVGMVPPRSTRVLHVNFEPGLPGVYADTLVIHAQQPDSHIHIPVSGSADIILPPVDSLVIQKGALNGIRLDWAPVMHSITGRPVENVAYIVYGATTPEGPFVPFGFTTTTSFVHPYVLNSQPIYFYRITADSELPSDPIILQQTETVGGQVQ